MAATTGMCRSLEILTLSPPNSERMAIKTRACKNVPPPNRLGIIPIID
jgi:hypothetical protein